MNGDNIKIIDFMFNKQNCTFSLNINLISFIILIFVVIAIQLLIKVYRNKAINSDIELTKIKYKIGNSNLEYQVTRNYKNIEIAHNIYIELITRKLAIEIDENDVIVEIYNSWYSLFKITRDELKLFDGKLLKENNTSKELVKLLSDVLNLSLRPHLTKYQAEFKRWYDEELENNKTNSPQEIQRKHPKYKEIFEDIKEVNKSLKNYSKELLSIIDGKKTV